MITLFIWIFFGILAGWIGYLVTRTNGENHSAPYLLIGVIGAILGGLITRNLKSGYLNASDLTTALIVATLAVAIFSFYNIQSD